MAPGEVAEWSNAPHSKCGIGASLSGVRIPPSPPSSPRRDALFQCCQPFDESFLADMLLTDRVKSTKEVLDRTSFLGDRLKIEEKCRRLVIGCAVAPLDFGLDLAPDAFTPLRYRQ